MADLSPKLLYIGSDTLSNVYTVSNAVGSYAILRNINICNHTSSSVLLDVYVVPPFGAPYSNNVIMSNFAVSAHETVSYDAGIVLDADYAIYVVHGGYLTLTISGVEYTP